MPEKLNFKTLAFKESKQMGFDIFNFSSVTIHFMLKCRASKTFEILKNPEKDVKVIPEFGTLEPGRSMSVEIIFTPQQKGFYELTIDYLLRSQISNLCPILNSESHSICNLICDCCLPTLQVR